MTTLTSTTRRKETQNVSSLPIEGTISAKPFANFAGSISAPVGRLSGSISAEPTDSLQNSASADVGNLITSLGTLSAQAQTMPLSPPTLPGLPQNNYKPQSTDYLQFASDAD
jgi:hypothetical protein